MDKKYICYLIFNDSPSSVVRATTFEEEYVSNNINPFFFKIYSHFLISLSKWATSKEIIILSLVINKLNALFEILKSKYFLRICNRYDALILIKYVKPEFLDKIKQKFKGKILYDFDDAVWVDYIMGLNKFEKIVSNVDYVSCDNRFLLDKSKVFNNNSFILNGPTQVEKFKAANKTRNDNKIVIGWVGSPDTLFYLYAAYDALEHIGSYYSDVVFRILGTGYDLKRVPNFEKIKVEYVYTYDEKIMISEVVNFDIGIFPLFMNDLSCGRGLLKAKIYMSASVPSICSNIGTAGDLILNDVNGYLCSDTKDWIFYLSKLIESQEKRIEIGRSGYKTVLEGYNKKSCFLELKNNFLDLL